MGNTPFQQPAEGSTSEAGEPATDTSLAGRVIRAARSFVDACRSKASVLSSPTAASAATADEQGADPREPTDGTDRSTGADGADRSSTDLPKRRTSFTTPPRSRDTVDAPELHATREDGRLSIYDPDRDDASITSDTWHRVER